MTNTEKAIQEYNKIQSEYNKQIEVMRTNMHKDLFVPIFEKFPNVGYFSWSQFTPSFNDGDACYFGVYNDEHTIVDIKGEDIEEYSDEWETINNYIHEVVKPFDEEMMEKLFGEGKIIVTPTDITIDDDYDRY